MTNLEAGIHEFDKSSPSNCIGNLFYGSQGAFLPAMIEGGDHFANFIDAVRSRKRENLNCEIEEGAISTALLHLANVSYRVRRTLHFDAASYSCTGDAEANKMFKRDYRAPFAVPKLA
jgi:GFO/IDH/MocA oxidoreductase family protein